MKMVLLYRDGITVQAISAQEVDEYKRLGFVEVEEPKQAQKPDAKAVKPVKATSEPVTEDE